MTYKTSDLSSQNVLRDVHDVATQSLRTTATAIIPPGQFEVSINHEDDSIRLGDGTILFTGTTVGPKTGLDVNVINEVSVSDADVLAKLIEIKTVLTDGNLKVDDDQSQALLSNILTQLGTTLKTDDDQSQLILTDILNKLNLGVLKVDDDQTQVILNNLETILSAIQTLLSGTLKVDDDQTQVILSNLETILTLGTLKVDDDQTQAILLALQTILSSIQTLLTGTLKVDDDQTQSILTSIETILNSGTLKVDDDQTQSILTTIANQLLSGTLKVDDDQTQTLLTAITNQLQAGSLSIGTEDGTPTGTQHIFVNNIRQMILNSHDRIENYTYTTIGAKDRLDKIEYTSPTFPLKIARKSFTWGDFGTKNERILNINWTII